MDPAIVTTGVTTELLKLGLPGAIILLLILALWRIFNLYVTVQEKRTEEAKLFVSTTTANTQAIENLGDIIREQRRAS